MCVFYSYDIGVVSTKEPFQKLVSQGMILGEVEYTAYRDAASGNFQSVDALDKPQLQDPTSHGLEAVALVESWPRP